MVGRHGRATPAWLAVALAGCGDDPMPPVACGAIPQQTVTVGEQVLVEPCFEDPEMGALTLAAVSSNPEVATVEVARNRVRIGGVSPGTAAITVTATDPDMLEGELSFEVLVPNRPPALLGEMPAARISLGGPPVRLVLSGYFADPDGQQLTYGATSSDIAVASVALLADTQVVAGLSVGTATVTVTATDPGGLSATARMDVTVRVNRPPVVVEPLLNRSSFPGSGIGYSVRPYFSDPDGDTLIYSAVSSNPGVSPASILGDPREGWIWIAFYSIGATTISVTATDPGGLHVTSEFEVRVVSKALPFRDDFESDESLDGWILWDASNAEFGEGMVRVTHLNRPKTLYSGLYRRVGAKNWTASARMGNVTEDSWVQLSMWLGESTGRPRPAERFHLQVGADPEHHWTEDDTNWRLLGRYDRGRDWRVLASGESEAVGGLGELVNVTLSHVGPTLTVAIGDSVVFSSTRFGHSRDSYIGGLNLGAWPADHGSTVPRTGVFDWVELRGDTSGIYEYEPDEVDGDTAHWVEVNGGKVETWRTGPKWQGVRPLLRVSTKHSCADGSSRPRGRLHEAAAASKPDSCLPIQNEMTRPLAKRG